MSTLTLMCVYIYIGLRIQTVNRCWVCCVSSAAASAQIRDLHLITAAAAAAIFLSVG